MPTYQALPSGKVRVVVRKRGHYEGKSFRTKTEAKSWANALEARLDDEFNGVKTQPKRTTLKSLLDIYANSFASPRHYHGNCKRQLCKGLGADTLINDLPKQKLLRYADHRLKTVQGSTLYMELRFLASALDWAADERNLAVSGDIARSALRSISRRGYSIGSNSRDRVLSDDEMQKLYDYWTENPPFVPMIEMCKFALLTGMRRGEILRIEAKDFDPEASTMVIRQRKHPRSKYDAVVPLFADAAAMVQERIDEGFTGKLFPYASMNVSRGFRRTCGYVGIEDARFHDLRHTCITRLTAAGMTPAFIMTISGHSSLGMLSIYTNLKPADTLAEAKRLGLSA